MCHQEGDRVPVGGLFYMVRGANDLPERDEWALSAPHMFRDRGRMREMLSRIQM